jgi:hypothetical protein
MISESEVNTSFISIVASFLVLDHHIIVLVSEIKTSVFCYSDLISSIIPSLNYHLNI